MVRKRTSSNNLKQALNKAILLQQQGKAAEAEACFLRILTVDSKHAAALYSLAAICENSSRLDQALLYISDAIKSRPSFAQAYLAKSIILLRLGQPALALEEVSHALDLDPSLPAAAEHRATVIGVLSKDGKTDLTEGLTTELPQAQSKEIMRALELQSSGQTALAAQAFEKILGDSPNNFVALYSLGIIANQNGDSRAALDYLDRAVTASPTVAIGFYARGTVQQGLGLYEDAISSFDQALLIQPAYKEAFTNKCSVLHSMNRQLEAVETMHKALELFPDDTGLLNNMGYLLTEFKQYSQSSRFFRRLVEIDPDYENALGLLGYSKLHACDWFDYEAIKAQILAGVAQGKRVCNPMALMAFTDDANLLQQCAVNFGKVRFPPSADPLWRGERYRHRRKRIAFLSADFREHPVGYLLVELIEKMPSLGYETIGVSLGHDDGSFLHKRYRHAFTHYISCHDKTSFEIASVLRAFETDVAIDLAGYTSGTRLEVLGYRPCPMQATYLGFPGTLGLPYIDYLIADYFIVPDAQEQFYSERVLKLPHSYLPRDSGVIATQETPTRESQGLPSSGLVLCSFNHDYKINPPLFDVWMRLLVEYDHSVLWLMQLNPDARTNLEKEASNRGVDPSRLVFASRVPKVEDHLARYRLVDLFLDTFPYGGHTTASDALLMNTPVVSMSGRSFASRVAGCMLDGFQMSENIASSIDEYLSIARRLLDKAHLRIRADNRFPPSDMLVQEFANCIEKMK